MLFFYSFFDKSFFSWFVRVMDLYSILNMEENEMRESETQGINKYYIWNVMHKNEGLGWLTVLTRPCQLI